MVEFIAIYETCGTPNPALWRPLSMGLDYSDPDVTRPTPGSLLYELDGEPVSISPDCVVTIWNEVEEERFEESEEFLLRIQRDGHRLTQAEFDASRNRFGMEMRAPA